MVAETPMASLKNILELNMAEARNMGGTSATALQAELTAYRQRLFWTFFLVLVVIIGLVAFGAYLIAVRQNAPGELALYSSALGITAGGGVEIARRMWSEWSRAGLVALLIQDAPDAMVHSVLEKLARKL
jgi:hypothetical protein